MRRLMLLLVACLTFLAPRLNAQRMVAGPAHFGPRFARGEHSRGFFYPLAYGDPFLSDYVRTAPVASQPPVVILQTPPAAMPVAPSPGPAQPLMIELKGDRYVRVSGDQVSDEKVIDPIASAASHSQAGGNSDASIGKVAPLPPSAILVFRDGHREEVSDYTIADGVLYTSSDYYTSGSWNKKIVLTSLNVAATISINQARGIRFQFPSAPNEVLIGP